MRSRFVTTSALALVMLAAVPAAAGVFGCVGYLNPSAPLELVTASGGSIGLVRRLVPTAEFGALGSLNGETAFGIFTSIVEFTDGSADFRMQTFGGMLDRSIGPAGVGVRIGTAKATGSAAGNYRMTVGDIYGRVQIAPGVHSMVVFQVISSPYGIFRTTRIGLTLMRVGGNSGGR